MANPIESTESAKPTAGEATALKLEQAAKDNNAVAFRNAMDEVTAARSSNPKEADKYMKDLTNKLKSDDALPQLALFNTKVEFSNLDTNQDGKLDKVEIKSLITHPLERVLLDKASKSITDPIDIDDLKEAEDKERKDRVERSHIRNLFKTDDSGKSLFDRIRSQDGSISRSMVESYLTIAEQNASRVNLSEEDIATLKFLKIETKGTPLIGRNNLNKDEVEAMRKRIADS